MSYPAIKGKLLSHIIWNEHNPDDIWEIGYVIHHKDKDPKNNEINNLEKIKIEDHIKLHHAGKITSEETKNKISITKTGKKRPPFTIEHKTKIGLANKGHKTTLGKKFSEETRRKMSESRRKWKFNEETIEKIRLKSMGRKHTEETKRKLSEKAKGRKHSEETKEKMKKAKVLRKINEKIINHSI